MRTLVHSNGDEDDGLTVVDNPTPVPASFLLLVLCSYDQSRVTDCDERLYFGLHTGQRYTADKAG